jgi:hypothetical protein
MHNNYILLTNVIIMQQYETAAQSISVVYILVHMYFSSYAGLIYGFSEPFLSNIAHVRACEIWV